MDEAEYRQKLERIEESLSDLYRERRQVMAEFSGTFPLVLPKPRNRTDVQQRVARCPRCGGRLSDSDGAKI